MPAFGAVRQAIPISISGAGILGSKSFSSSAGGHKSTCATSLKSFSYSCSMDFGAYLLSTSPPVNFALSYASIEQGYDPGDKTFEGKGTKPNGYNDPSTEQQLLINRCSSDLSDVRGLHGDAARGRLRDVSPSFSTKTFGHFRSDNTYRNIASCRSEHKVKPCLRTWSLYETNYNNESCKTENLESVEDYNGKYLNRTRVKSKTSKKVSFADDIGHNLVLVRIFDEPFDVPSLVCPTQTKNRKLRADTQSEPSQSATNLSKSTTCPAELESVDSPAVSFTSSTSPETELPPEAEQNEVSSRKCLVVPNFPMPAASYASYRRKIEENCVSLESAHQLESKGSIWGTIKVKEIAYEKQVFVRVTFNGWETTSDIQAEFVAPTDAASIGRVLPFATFSFLLTLPNDTRTLARRGIQFAVCYRAAGREFWDNNNGCNYEFNCPDWATSGMVTSSSITRPRGSVELRDRRNTASEEVYHASEAVGWGSFAAWSDVDATIPYW